MAFRILGSGEPKYLAATDILIGDMSSVNYEFLLYDRPVILLANDWVRKFFPEIGIKTNLAGLPGAIERSLQHPDEFREQRRFWLDKTIFKPFEKNAAKRYVDIMIKKSGFEEPMFVLLHGNDAVRKTNLAPLAEEISRQGIKLLFISDPDSLNSEPQKDVIFVGAHFCDLSPKLPGFIVHIDHDLKGKSSTNLCVARKDYERHGYFPHIGLHITPGEVGDRRTRFVLGPLASRTVVGGYPKADDFLGLNTKENKMMVYEELCLETDKPLVTYAPAGRKSYMKPGGSLRKKALSRLERISQGADFHVLVKMKYESEFKKSRGKQALVDLRETLKLMVWKDCGRVWDNLVKDYNQ